MCWPYYDLRCEEKPMSGVLSFPDHTSMDVWLVDTLGMNLCEITAHTLPPDYEGKDVDEAMLKDIADEVARG
jgi:hypothetical protein